jgi:two-component system response regulator AtoC
MVVDDAEGIRTYLASLLELKGYQVDTAEDGRRALALLEEGAAPDVVLLDIMMPGIDGIETLRQIREQHENLPVVMLSVVGRASTIVQAMQLGAVDYLNKPFEEEELDSLLARVLSNRDLQQERERLRGMMGVDPQAGVWQSDPMQQILEVIQQISDTDVTVLIQGESGVGKEVVARRIHAESDRAKKPFVKVNCAALPDDLLESELFGYEVGAFTGANFRKPGRFELADKGTMFLDEIGEMSPGLQGKLLQVLQDGEFTRLGGNKEVKVDTRVVCATNRPLLEMVEQKTFREDLYFRLNVVNIEVPPLRDRRDEIPALMDCFLRRSAARYGKPYLPLSPRLQGLFQTYPFPGNVREFENMIKRIVVLESEASVVEELVRDETAERESGGVLRALISEVEETAGELPLREVGRRVAMQAERETIERALQRTRWNRKQAAKLLNVSYKTLLQKIRDCGLEPEA